MNPDGTLKHVCGCVTDISRQKWQDSQILARTLEAERSEIKWTRFAERAPVGITVQKSDEAFTYTNQAFSRITGHVEDSPVSWRNIIHEADFEDFDKFIKAAMSREVQGRLKKLWSTQNEQHHT